MTDAVANPLFHVSLGDRDEWVVEAEWPDGTLERVSWTEAVSANPVIVDFRCLGQGFRIDLTT